MFWDLTNKMQEFASNRRIILVDVIGQPNESHGHSPRVRGRGYGHWMSQLAQEMGIVKADWGGISFGGFLVLKLNSYAPHLIRKTLLFNPAGFTSVRLLPKNVPAAIHSRVSPDKASIDKFLRKVVFTPEIDLNQDWAEPMNSIWLNRFKHFRTKAQLPYIYKDDVIRNLKKPCMLITGEEDRLFNSKKIRKRAEKLISNLEYNLGLQDMGHGLERFHDINKELKKFLEVST
jgi:pimeloyl-ACP methyl ester carboxylesterase